MNKAQEQCVIDFDNKTGRTYNWDQFLKFAEDLLAINPTPDPKWVIKRSGGSFYGCTNPPKLNGPGDVIYSDLTHDGVVRTLANLLNSLAGQECKRIDFYDGESLYYETADKSWYNYRIEKQESE